MPKLMYPEPAATGGGAGAPAAPAAPADTTPADTAPTGGTPAGDELSLFNDALTKPQGNVNVQTPMASDTDYQLDFADVDYTDSEKQMISELGKKHGLDAGSLSAFARDLKSQLDADDAAAKRQLIQDWGANARANATRVGAFLQQVGQAFNWPPERMQALNSADVFRVMHDIVSFVSGNRPAAGLRQAAVSPPAKSEAELKADMRRVVGEYYDAMKRNDTVAMTDCARRHSDIIYALTGKREMQLATHM